MNAYSHAPRASCRRFYVFLGCLLLTGCLNDCSCSRNRSVTPANPQSPEVNFDQSETALTTSYSNAQDIVVVAYNDGTDTSSTIKYTAKTRIVLPGASMMGWSYSLDKGQTWTYGGKVLPPENWAALWGDPALTTSETHYNVVFMSNLAIPSSKMPKNGISGPVNAFLGGACIARSGDGGKHFKVYQMLSNQSHFYDGGSMAASKGGGIFAAFVDVDTNHIDVWSAPNDSGQFVPMPNPFPNMLMYSHPRIRISPFDDALYVAAQASDWAVYMTRWTGQTWSPPVRVSNGPVELYPNTKFVTGTVLRNGPQFSFDIGAASTEDSRDAVRVMCTQRDPETGRMFVTGSYGKADLSGFWAAPEWGTTPGNLNTPGDQFNPNVRAWPGFIGLPPVWKATFMNRDPNAKDKVDLEQGNLAYLPNGTRIYVPFMAVEGIPVCPDLRAACDASGHDDPSGHYCGGYWGDYDDLAITGFDSNGAAQFLRTVSDSSLGCQYRWQYTSHHVHISATTFP
jgi:hypothetical protein